MAWERWRRWLGSREPDGWPAVPRGRTEPRVRGFPPSANGASSFHLRWLLDERGAAPIRSASVVLEVVDPPRVPRLHFWALQVDVEDALGRRAGGAHLGLQWHPEHPGSTAVNWGGYDQDGTVLHGSDSALPSALHNPHTRDFGWVPCRPYRLKVEPAPAQDQPDREHRGSVLTAWRGSLTDLTTGECTVVRDLHAWGDRIAGVIMWSEVFARCDDPQVAVRWSDATVTGTDGRTRRPGSFRVNYQAPGDGGCANTTSQPDSGFRHDGGVVGTGQGGFGVLQVTNAERTTPQGAVIRNL